MIGNLKDWETLPVSLRTDAVRPYYDKLKKRKGAVAAKRVFDMVAGSAGLVILSPIMAVIAVCIALDSPGGVFFRQTRITQYGKEFQIHKFRTMVKDAPNLGSQITVSNDARITRVGGFLRKYRLDELPQLIDVVQGTMSFVGTRPEVPKYVEKYSPEMMATLLLPAGVTSRASIEYKDESLLLDRAQDPDKVYVETILPAKMEYNLKSLDSFSLKEEWKTLFATVAAVLKQEEA